MQIDVNLHSGSQIRPIKMIQAFKDIGYEVDIVMGYVSDRRKQIKEIKQNIKNGTKYDFLYSESSTMPTALTEKHHLPIAPFLDFSFFKFCRDNNIKIGLFYRDIHWDFEQYKNNISFFKHKISRLFYKFDLYQYQKYIDTFYLPAIQMYDYIPFTFTKDIVSLPPAVEIKNIVDVNNKNNVLEFIYVGGLGTLYNLLLFTSVISKLDNIKFNLCTRKNEWLNNENKYDKYLNNINVHHKNGNELISVYEKSSIAILFVELTSYWKFVMAVKLFEYIAYKKPIIAVKNTAVGDFIESNNIGWVISYDKKELEKLINSLQKNPSQIGEKIKNIEKITPNHTWEARAKQVQEDLTI
jgi:glycosyltransferase involved in cell wall biosynthesis